MMDISGWRRWPHTWLIPCRWMRKRKQNLFSFFFQVSYCISAQSIHKAYLISVGKNHQPTQQQHTHARMHTRTRARAHTHKHNNNTEQQQRKRAAVILCHHVLSGTNQENYTESNQVSTVPSNQVSTVPSDQVSSVPSDQVFTVPSELIFSSFLLSTQTVLTDWSGSKTPGGKKKRTANRQVAALPPEKTLLAGSLPTLSDSIYKKLTSACSVADVLLLFVYRAAVSRLHSHHSLLTCPLTTHRFLD